MLLRASFLSTLLVSVLAVPSHETLPEGGSYSNNKAICAVKSVTINKKNSTIWPWQSYVSSNLTPPWLSINKTGEQLAPGLVLFTQQVGIDNSTTVKQQYPLIMRDTGDLVWAGPAVGSTNLRRQTLYGKSVLTYWAGSGAAATSANAGHGFGNVTILNQSMTPIYTVCPQIDIVLPPGSAPAPCKADIHEQFITPQNTLLVTSYNLTTADLTSVGGPKKGWVFDPLVVEVDIKTGKPLWQWSPLEHVPLNNSRLPLGTSGRNSSDPWDWFHTNSVQPFENQYLINSRNLWTTYLVNKTGHTVWKIDGQNGGDFGKLPAAGHFSWEHHARIKRLSKTTLRIHYFANNNGFPLTNSPSTGVELDLTDPPNKAHPPKLITDLSYRQNPIVSFAEGSYVPLENGNTFMGYGIQPFMREYGPNSTGEDLRWSAQFGYTNGAQSYRGYKTIWSATPNTKPALVAKTISGKDQLSSCAAADLRGYVSWNGATNVTSWVVYGGSSKSSLKQVGQVPSKGFETEFSLPKGTKYVSVGAVLTGSKDVVRKSDIVAVRS